MGIKEDMGRYTSRKELGEAVAMGVLEVEAKADARKIQNEAAAQQAVKQAKLELEARTAAAQQAISKSKSDYEAKIAAANQNKVVKQFGIDFWRKREAEKAKAQDKKAQEAGKAEATGITPIKEQFKSEDAFDGPQSSPSIQVSQDAATGQPSPGGGGLGADVRAAMAGVPPGLVTTTRDTGWEPRTASGFMRPMPVDRQRRTVAPTGMTQAQAGALKMREQELLTVQMNSKKAEANRVRKDTIAYAGLLGNAEDALYGASVHPSLWSKEFKKKLTNAAVASGMEKARAARVAEALAMSQEIARWEGKILPQLQKRVQLGMVTARDQVSTSELFGFDPLETGKQQEDVRARKADGVASLNARMVEKEEDINSIDPEVLMSTVGEPASFSNQVVVAVPRVGEPWRVEESYRAGKDWLKGYKSETAKGFALAPTSEIFNIVDDLGNPLLSDEQKRDAKAYLIALRVIDGVDDDGGLVPVANGTFSITSDRFVTAYERMIMLEKELGLTRPAPELDILQRKQKEAAEAASQSPELADMANKQAREFITNLIGSEIIPNQRQ